MYKNWELPRITYWDNVQDSDSWSSPLWTKPVGHCQKWLQPLIGVVVYKSFHYRVSGSSRFHKVGHNSIWSFSRLVARRGSTWNKIGIFHYEGILLACENDFWAAWLQLFFSANLNCDKDLKIGMSTRPYRVLKISSNQNSWVFNGIGASIQRIVCAWSFQKTSSNI